MNRYQYAWKQIVLWISDGIIMNGTKIGMKYRTDSELKVFIEMADIIKHSIKVR